MSKQICIKIDDGLYIKMLEKQNDLNRGGHGYTKSWMLAQGLCGFLGLDPEQYASFHRMHKEEAE